MIVDFRRFDDGAVIEADLCVIGAGAAGITIAREFIGSHDRLCLVESGGFEMEDDTQSLYEGENVGLPYDGLEACRLRFLGGTTGHWGGYCAPMNELDFEPRSWVPNSGWPITKTDLEPYYRRAHADLGLGPYVYDDRVWQILGVESALGARLEKLRTRFWHINPLRFGEAYRQELEKAVNVQVLLHANVTDIHADDAGGTVEHVEIRTLEGKRGRIRAKAFVLACGGIENARQLLASNKMVAKGLGNRYDLVGRFFMEHVHVQCGVVVAHDPDEFAPSFQDYERENLIYKPGLCFEPRVQAREQVLNCGTRYEFITAPGTGSRAVREIQKSLDEGQFPDDLSEKIARIMRDMGDVSRNVYRHFTEEERAPYGPLLIRIRVQSEQAPNPESRVTLSDQRDALGINRARLNWRMTDLDRRTIEVMAKVIGTEFGRLNLGRVRVADWLADERGGWGPKLDGGCHHMGTTRMSDDPKSGVVDRNCRLHGSQNFYIAGSSVFSTSGYINPTLTIVALALRLVSHLKTQLA